MWPHVWDHRIQVPSAHNVHYAIGQYTVCFTCCENITSPTTSDDWTYLFLISMSSLRPGAPYLRPLHYVSLDWSKYCPKNNEQRAQSDWQFAAAASCTSCHAKLPILLLPNIRTGNTATHATLKVGILSIVIHIRQPVSPITSQPLPKTPNEPLLFMPPLPIDMQYMEVATFQTAWNQKFDK